MDGDIGRREGRREERGRVDADARERLNEALDRLPEGNLRALLDVLQRLEPHRPMRRWTPEIGGLSDEDADEMRRAIEDVFERVETDAW